MFLFFSWNDFVPKIENFFEETFAHMTDRQFRRWFRINPDTFHQLADILIMGEDIFTYGRKPMDFKKRLAMT